MKKHRTRRWLALLLTAGMLVGLVPADGTQAVHAAGEFDADEGLLAHYPLETDVKDVSGNHKDASITEGASGVDFSGDALNLGRRRPEYGKLCDLARRVVRRTGHCDRIPLDQQSQQSDKHSQRSSSEARRRGQR